MNILGMRGLQSPGLLPVKKAFVNFNLKGLVPPKIGTNLKNLKTVAKAPGANPTINTLMKFEVPLPTEELFCPRLSCQVYDTVFAGFSQPIIGNFTIPIGALMISLHEERTSEIKALRTVVETLDKVARGEARDSLLAKSMRGMVQEQLKADGAGEDAIAAIRMTPEAKLARLNEFSAKRRKDGLMIEEEVSVNQTSNVDTTGLLTGDSNEELRMQPRLIEKAENAKQGKMPRVTVDDIRNSQKGSPLISEDPANEG